MKWIFIVLLACVSILGTARLTAQDASTAAAEREQAEERFRSLSKRVEGIEESIAAFQKNTIALREEVRHMREDLDRFKTKNEGAATQDNIKRLAEKIEEVDKKRQADNEKTLKYIDTKNGELQKFILEKATGGARTPVPPAANPGGEKPRLPAGPVGGRPETGFEYKIKSGDNVSKIVTALKAQGFKATNKQIMDANPNVDWTRLKIDQKIFIPDSR